MSEWPESLRRAFRSGKVVPFVGAGVSMAVRNRNTGRPLFPSWTGALLKGVEALEKEQEHDKARRAKDLISSGDLTNAALEIRRGLPADAWRRFLTTQFDRRQSEASEESLATARAVWGLGARVLITTNYDDVLSWTCPYRDAARWELENPAELIAYLRGQYEGAAIWHLHGRYDHAANVILTLESYDELYADEKGRYEAALSTLRVELLTKSLLFVGFSLNDARFVSELEKASEAFRGFGGGHFALLARDETQGQGVLGSRLRAIGVQPLFYDAPGGDHSRLLRHLEDLCSLVTERPDPLEVRSLPQKENEFVGREREVDMLAELMTGEDERLVALVGPAGSGKTRLMRRLVSRLGGTVAGGTQFADLTDATTVKGLSYGVSRALGVSLTGVDSPETTVANLLPHHPPTVLILDHFEQLVRPSPLEALARWCELAPNIRFLVTTTKPLGIGERVVEMGPLAHPNLAEVAQLRTGAARRFDAVRLFVARREDRDPSFQLRGEYEDWVPEICAYLNGLPLAIELAAAHPDDPMRIRQALEEMLSADIRGSDGDVTPELHAALVLSVGALSPKQRRALIQLCVCNGTFFEQDAAALLGVDERDAAGIISRLWALGLMESERVEYGDRVGVLPAVRSWVASHLVEPEDVELRAEGVRRHRSHYLQYARMWAGEFLGMRPREAVDRLELELEDLIAIHEDARAAGDAVVAAQALLYAAPVFQVRGPANVLPQYAEPVLEMLGDANQGLASRLLAALAIDALGNSAHARAQGYADRALERAEAGGDLSVRAQAKCVKVLTTLGRGPWDMLEAQLQDAREQFLELGSSRGAAWADGLLGRVHSSQGRYRDADRHFEAAEQLKGREEETLLECEILRWRGDNLGATCPGRSALEQLARAERIAERIRFPSRLWTIRNSIAVVQSRMGLIEESLEGFKALRADALLRGDRYEQALATSNLADTYRQCNRLAERTTRESIVRFRELDSRAHLAMALANLAAVLRDLGQHDEALEHARQAHTLVQDLGIGESVNGWLATATLARAEYRRGSRSYAQSLAMKALERSEYRHHDDLEVRENWQALDDIVSVLRRRRFVPPQSTPAQGRH